VKTHAELLAILDRALGVCVAVPATSFVVEPVAERFVRQAIGSHQAALTMAREVLEEHAPEGRKPGRVCSWCFNAVEEAQPFPCADYARAARFVQGLEP
jgi:hypothetical protein